MKAIKTKSPKLIISPLVKEKMNSLVRMSAEEIAWHGFIEKKNDDTYYWYDIIMYPQYNTACTSTSEDEEYAKWLIRQMEFDNFEDMRIHGHSHVNMSCTPSGTDRAFRQDILANLKDDDYYFFLIVNKKGDYTLELYDYKTNLVYETKDIIYETASYEDAEKASRWAETAIKNNVKERNFQRCSTTSNLKNSLIPENSKDQSTSSDAVQWEDPLQKFFAGLA